MLPTWLLIYIFCGAIFMFTMHFISFLFSRRKDFIPNPMPAKPLGVVLLFNIIAIAIFPLLIIGMQVAYTKQEQDRRYLKNMLEDFQLMLKAKKEE